MEGYFLLVGGRLRQDAAVVFALEPRTAAQAAFSRRLTRCCGTGWASTGRFRLTPLPAPGPVWMESSMPSTPTPALLPSSAASGATACPATGWPSLTVGFVSPSLLLPPRPKPDGPACSLPPAACCLDPASCCCCSRSCAHKAHSHSSSPATGSPMSALKSGMWKTAHTQGGESW